MELTRSEKVRRLDAWGREAGLTARERRILCRMWIYERDIDASKDEMIDLLKKLMAAMRS